MLGGEGGIRTLRFTQSHTCSKAFMQLNKNGHFCDCQCQHVSGQFARSRSESGTGSGAEMLGGDLDMARRTLNRLSAKELISCPAYDTFCSRDCPCAKPEATRPTCMPFRRVAGALRRCAPCSSTVQGRDGRT